MISIEHVSERVRRLYAMVQEHEARQAVRPLASGIHVRMVPPRAAQTSTNRGRTASTAGPQTPKGR